jgi:hypothetical protein
MPSIRRSPDTGLGSPRVPVRHCRVLRCYHALAVVHVASDVSQVLGGIQRLGAHPTHCNPSALEFNGRL